MKFARNILNWLDQHALAIMLAGIIASLIKNILALRKNQQVEARIDMSITRPVPSTDLPLVSFLVPAWNEAHHVDACIHSILALRYPNKELILCAGGTDATLAICQPFAGDFITILEQQPGEGKQGALRRSFEHSSGEILFLTDADCVVDDVSVEATLAPLLFERESTATGYWKPFEADQQRPFVAYQWANHLRYQAGMPDWAETLDGRNSAVRREALLVAGAFQNEAATGTDYVLSQELKRAGYHIRSIPASRVQTEYPIEIMEYLDQGSRWYRNRLVQGIQFKQWRDVASSLWGAGASLFMLAGPLLTPWRIARYAWLAGVFHLGLSAARLALFFQRTGYNRKSLLYTTVTFTGFTWVSDLSMIKGLLASVNRDRRKTW